MDVVKLALSSSGITVHAAPQCVKERKDLSPLKFCCHIFLVLMVFSDSPYALEWLPPRECLGGHYNCKINQSLNTRCR